MEENSQVTECEYQVGYRVSILRCLLVIPLAVLPLFTGLLLMYWFPHVATRVLSTKVPLCKAQIVIVKVREYCSLVVHTVNVVKHACLVFQSVV